MTDQKPPLTMRDADPATFQTSAAAPATILDAARAPGTIRDAAGAPGTIRDAAGAPGTTHDSGSAPGTTRDQGTPGPRTADSRFIRPLPPTLQARYEVQRDLGGGGEADLVLVSDRETAEQCVVRLYRRQDLPLDENKLDRLRTADRKHLIGLLDYGRGDGYVWEILEYAPEGSLEEMIKSYRAPWPAAQVLDIFDQLAPAITYANSLGMVHRDIKPGNILIRSLHPLDLVLADFGLAKILAATQHHGTTSMTAAYAPPEAISGHASLSVDWWSLGIILLELLNGLHPFQIPDDKRSWQNEQVITTFLITKDIDLSEVTDERWRLLLRGLLTRAPDKRWGAQQVAMWRAGGTPAVAKPDPARPAATYVFGGVGYNDPVKLAAALRQNWSEGRRLLAGRQIKAPQYLALKDWMTKHERTEAVRALDNGVDERPERGLMQVIMALDPDVPPEFNGHRLDGEHLHTLARTATGQDQNALQLIDQIYEDGILTICDDAPGCAGFAMLDDRWHRSVEAAYGRLNQLGVAVQPHDLQHMRVQLLVASHEGQQGSFTDAAWRAAQNKLAREQQWFSDLTEEQVDPSSEAAQHAVLMLSAAAAEQQTTNQRIENERERFNEEQRRIEDNRRKLDGISVPLGVICGVLAVCVSPLGLLAGPAAVYFGVRARRTDHRTASTWAIALGGLGSIIGLITLIVFISGAFSGNGTGDDMTTVIDRLFFGRDEAELDATKGGLLRAGFLRTAAYESAATGRKRLIIGRKGAGKSAICTMLHADEPASCLITPDDASGHEARSFQLSGVAPTKAKEIIWRYVIAVQLAKYLVTHARQVHRKQVPESIETLRRFLAANGEAADFTLHEKLWRVIKRLKSSLALEAFGAKIALEVSGPSEGIRAINQLEVIEDGVAAAMTELACPRDHGGPLLLIDQIESIWSDNPESEHVVIGLLMAAKQVPQRFPGVRCCVFLRTDIYDRLKFTERDKLRGEEMRIDWSSLALQDLLVQRVRASLTTDLPAPRLWDSVFHADAGNDLVSHTLRRPRDVIQLANRCRDVAAQSDHIQITQEDVSEALELFSAWKLQDLSDEFLVNYPFLPRVLSTFEDSGYFVTRERLVNQLGPVLADARDDFPAHIRFLTVDAVVEMLFDIGFLGTGSPWAPAYSYDRNARVKQTDTTFLIHPCFRPALRATMRDNAIELDPRYLAGRALRSNIGTSNVFGGITTGHGPPNGGRS